jgi:GrpB-like predicted nucleotidyltransferase (UPF0157 family)/isopentenyldiphosphate isomerase
MSLGLHWQKVKLVPYDPKWAQIYKDEEAQLRRILAGDNLVNIHHIGSTNVPGIESKPVMGILITVKDISKAREWNEELENSDYVLREDEPGHLLYTKGPDENQTMSLKIAEADSDYAKFPLLFDNYLRQNPHAAKDYEKLKKELAKKYPNDRQKYTAAKHPFIRKVIKDSKTKSEKPELIDVLDSEGRPTGEAKQKMQILLNGDWRDVIHVWLVNNRSDLLVQQRAKKGLWDNLWDVSVGGGVSASEAPIDTAQRELKEELGILVSTKDLRKLGVWKMTKPLPELGVNANEFSHTFLLLENIDVRDLSLRESEVKKVEWKKLEHVRHAIDSDKLYKMWVPHPKVYYGEVIDIIERQFLESN